MTEERKHAILTAATILLARKLQTTLETEALDYQIEHYKWRADSPSLTHLGED